MVGPRPVWQESQPHPFGKSLFLYIPVLHYSRISNIRTFCKSQYPLIMSPAFYGIKNARRQQILGSFIFMIRGEGSQLGNLGLAYRHLGQVEKARPMLAQSLAIFEEIQSPSAELVRKWLAELDADGGQ